MKIPNNLPKFKDETVIIVAGRQDAIIYKAWHDTINRLDAFKVPTPHYSDHPCEFKQRGKEVFISSGGVKELRDQDIIRDFLHEFERHIKKLHKFSRIYILAPAQVKNKIKSVLPASWHGKIRAVVEGNYYNQHPLYVIKKISDFELAPVRISRKS